MTGSLILTYSINASYVKQVFNILDSYGSLDAVKGDLGLHRLIEALKHMFAVRMNLGDPKFVNISNTVSEMRSPTYAKQIRQRIFDNTTFPADYYMYRCYIYNLENKKETCLFC